MERKDPEPENEVFEKERGPTDLLKEDHRSTLLKLELMERALRYLLSPPAETTPERVEAEKTLLRDIANGLEREMPPHFRKEEEGLFPILAEYIGKEHGLIEAMRHEHAKIWSAFFLWKKALFRFCDALGPIDEAVRTGALDAGLAIASLIRLHISKENHVLFKISESSLTEEEKEKVMGRMQGISETVRKRDQDA